METELVAREAKVQAGLCRQLVWVETWIERTERVIWQTHQELAKNVHIKDRLVRLVDPDARPIRKGKLRR